MAFEPNSPFTALQEDSFDAVIYAVRVDLDWRAVGVLRGDTLVWFWVGPHRHYEALLKAF